MWSLSHAVITILKEVCTTVICAYVNILSVSLCGMMFCWIILYLLHTIKGNDSSVQRSIACMFLHDD